MTIHVIADTVQMLLAATGGAGSTILTGAGAACGSSCGNPDVNGLFKNAANILTFLIGAISVLMVMWGGFQYTISRGDSAKVKGAKDTILYAVVGVVVSIVAYAIIKFVATTASK